jgi:N6-L-threonylcarbamoyladenine synthase
MERSGLSWNDVSGIAVTEGPGLAGALLVGVNYAKALAYGRGLPLVGVNHLEGHIASAWLADPMFPGSCVVLVVSGGHTHLYHQQKHGKSRLLGCTRDDAAGEAFDKGAQMLGLPYPGGPAIDRVARLGNPHAIPFPRFQPRRDQLEFSFSGLKTSLLYKLRDMTPATIVERQADLAACYQEAIVDVLVRKAFAAVTVAGVSALAVVGGVSANSRLRTRLAERAARDGVRLALPPFAYCTDNAAMIAEAGRRKLLAEARSLNHPEVETAVPRRCVRVTDSEETSHS